jgi:hypothetical protein
MGMASCMHNTGEWRVKLSYSCDHLAIGAEPERARELYRGDDLVTTALNRHNIDYMIVFMSDFYHEEPVLEQVIRRDEQGKEHVTYSESYYTISGPRRVLQALKELGVIPSDER